jgi:hypothetical protein
MSASVRELIQAQLRAIDVACRQLSGQPLDGLHSSVEQAAQVPARFDWDRKAASNAEIFNVLADAVRDPVLRQRLNAGAGLAHHLMMAAGPTAGGIIDNSWRRLLACLRAGNPGAAADELDRQLRSLHVLSCLAGRPLAGEPAL